ncbi:MAG: ribosome-associated translation inhibitor RaiA [Rikenellaceae bacterium]|jgi:putative sigma-54 modulation protein|nr:ribosome-associated translation inhibitor RaiA [Rikenellaceae bacterium]MBO7213024.1 ribosome-associated translation inhibitor RaiA [Rikenellaceae bacterium]MBR5000205.1 ribosome-associated translation inhibitor RaiA [Rikenellaceae bacterium]MBR6496014.1 ribosome-associated translation inhibitor RaiA [Rikenellaceae bacterium]
MNVKIQSVKFDADKKLIDFIESKVAKIDRFIDNIVSVDVTLKLDKDFDNGNKVATIKVTVPGDELVAERQCKSFEEAIDSGLDAIRNQVDKYKEKLAK